MVWYIFALLAALFDALYFLLIKKYLKSTSQYILASGVFLTTGMVLLIISLIKGIPPLGAYFVPAVLITTGLNVVAIILYLKAFQSTDLSLTVPMLSFTPLFLLVTSFLILKEFPTYIGIIGVILIVLGSYFLNANRHKNLLHPFRNMVREKGILAMLVVAFIFSISANFDKMVLLNSDPFFGPAMVFLLLGIIFLIISLVTKEKVKQEYNDNWMKFLGIGLILSLAALAQNLAYQSQIVTYVISLKRISIVLSVIFGGIFLSETNMTARIFGAMIMVVGVILIVLY